MGLLRKGLRLLSVLRRPEDERKNIVRVYAKARSWDDVTKLGKGEVVRKGLLIGIVVRQKSARQDGLVALVCASKEKWHYTLSYCPYLHELAYNGSCGLVTKAVSKDDGLENQHIIDELKQAKKEEDMNLSIAMPQADEYWFPAFEKCRISAGDAYLPSINELLLLTDDKELFGRFVRLQKELAYNDIKGDEGCCKLWSSTDVQHHYSGEDFSSSYSDAYAVSIGNDGIPETLSLIKTEEAWCIPFCRF